MTLSSNPGGEMLYFSREELFAASLAPEGLTRAQCLALVRRTLARHQRPIPPCMEVEIFPCRQGLVVFILPVLPKGTENGYFSVGFS